MFVKQTVILYGQDSDCLLLSYSDSLLAGLYFIVEADIKDFSNLKLDGVARSIFTILRHVGRLREIRGGGVTRLVVNEYY